MAMNLKKSACGCCGNGIAVLDLPDNMPTSAPIHFSCWDEHHSDPTTEWPVGHVCAKDKDE